MSKNVGRIHFSEGGRLHVLSERVQQLEIEHSDRLGENVKTGWSSFLTCIWVSFLVVVESEVEVLWLSLSGLTAGVGVLACEKEGLDSPGSSGVEPAGQSPAVIGSWSGWHSSTAVPSGSS